jgi:hypothetical protein
MRVLHYYPAGSLKAGDSNDRFVDDWNMPTLRRVYRKLRRTMSAWDARCVINDLTRVRTIWQEPAPSRPMPAGYETWF